MSPKSNFFPILLLLILPFSLPHPSPQKYIKKTIQIPDDGDTIDCFVLHHQPSLHHPLLKSHKVKAVPSFSPEDITYEEKGEVKQKWHTVGACPEGTVPIMRMKESFVRHQSAPPPRFSSTYHYNEDGGPTSPYEYAAAIVKGEYSGGKATINVWSPNVERKEEMTAAQMWLLTSTEHVSAGWQVNPSLYHDNKTRLTVGWMSSGDYMNDGCYNYQCVGFVQVSDTIALGASIEPLSISGDQNHQKDITVQIWMYEDFGVKYWCMAFGTEVVGYWPSYLFSSELRQGRVPMVVWGGIVLNMWGGDGNTHTSTEMGSGDFPDRGFANSAYFCNIGVVDSNNNLHCPNHISPFISNTFCYDIDVSDQPCHVFYYGGFGRSPICP